MGIQKYIRLKKELHDFLIQLLEKDDFSDQDNQDLIDFINSQNYLENREEFIYFLILLVNISNNYHRGPNFIKNLENIILCLEELIKQILSNREIYGIFKNNKLIFLFLVQRKILLFDEFIINDLEKNLMNESDYCHFLFPEVKDLISKKLKKQIKKELLNCDSNIFDFFDEKRKIGENDSYISSLIREDKVEEFISYVNRANIPSTSLIPHSFFETNSFLLENKNTSLIEYAAFYGSIQIFQYLNMNNAELKPTIWLYVIHSNSAEMIHLLEENNVDSPDDTYEVCLLESIKCHHNDIANYVKNNLVDQNFDESNRNKLIEKVFECSFHYSNYSYFPCDFNRFSAFFYLYRYHYLTLVNLFIKNEKDDLERKIVFKAFYIYQIKSNFFVYQILKNFILMKFFL